MAELFKFMKHADTVLDHPVGPELGNDTPRFMIEPVICSANVQL